MFVYFPIFLAAVALSACVWAFVAAKRLDHLEAEVRVLRIQSIRFVLPRRVSLAQKNIIAEELKKSERRQIQMLVVKNDEEAGQYRGEIQVALEQGGWVVSKVEFADAVREGLSIRSTEPLADPPAKQDPFERLVKKPKPAEVLAAALSKAGVQVEGTGSGQSREIYETTITIEIGSRRRDSYAVVPSSYVDPFRGERPDGYPRDEDFDDLLK
jgi:hypothetical protein